MSPVTRRDLLKTGAVVTGGLVIAFVVPGGKRLAFAAAATSSVRAMAPA